MHFFLRAKFLKQQDPKLLLLLLLMSFSINETRIRELSKQSGSKLKTWPVWQFRYFFFLNSYQHISYTCISSWPVWSLIIL